MPLCKAGSRELIWLTLSSTSPIDPKRLLIHESPQVDSNNRKAFYGETISAARVPFSENSLLLELQPGGFFNQGGPQLYWAFAAIFCIDDNVVEDMFVDWEKLGSGMGLHQHFPFKTFDAKPLQILTVGVFFYPIAGNGERMNRPQLISILEIKLVKQSAGGSFLRPMVGKPYLFERTKHPFSSDRDHPKPKGPDTTIHSSTYRPESLTNRLSVDRDQSFPSRGSSERKVSSNGPEIHISGYKLKRGSSRSPDRGMRKRREISGTFSSSNDVNERELDHIDKGILALEREEAELEMLEEELKMKERKAEFLKEQIRRLQFE